MFSIVYKEMTDQEEIRFSRAEGSSVLEATTKGLALKYVVCGNEYYELNGRSVRVKAGQYIIVPQDVRFKALNKEEFTTGICIDLSVTKLSGILPEMEELDILFGIPFGHLSMCSLASSIGNLNNTMRSGETVSTLSDIYTDLTGLGKIVSNMSSGLNKSYTKTESKQYALVRLLAAKDYICRRYSEKIMIAELASKIGMSGSHFQRLFKLCYQTSPKQLQQDVRMDKAASLIVEDRHSLQEIAYELGFTDLPAFSKQFKKKFEIPPSSYLKVSA